ncbi:hypothetical protein ACLOJK_014235 [Asimina triloba]
MIEAKLKNYFSRKTFSLSKWVLLARLFGFKPYEIGLKALIPRSDFSPISQIALNPSPPRLRFTSPSSPFAFDPLCRTKLVVRHLPPSIPQTALMEQIDARFAGRYKWFCFRPGKIRLGFHPLPSSRSKSPPPICSIAIRVFLPSFSYSVAPDISRNGCMLSSVKIQKYSRVYIDLQSPEDVLEFAEFFDGHVFVNEKGAQYKTIVEYAPSQRVPKPWTKKDGREGTIFKDPEYLEFLDLLAKPAEYLPSAEIQLERKEAERASAPKEVPIVTPLMDFVRQRRAAKSGTQIDKRTLVNGKLSRRAGGASSTASTRRNSEKRRVSTSVIPKVIIFKMSECWHAMNEHFHREYVQRVLGA